MVIVKAAERRGLYILGGILCQGMKYVKGFETTRLGVHSVLESVLNVLSVSR